MIKRLFANNKKNLLEIFADLFNENIRLNMFYILTYVKNLSRNNAKIPFKLTPFKL